MVDLPKVTQLGRNGARIPEPPFLTPPYASTPEVCLHKGVWVCQDSCVPPKCVCGCGCVYGCVLHTTGMTPGRRGCTMYVTLLCTGHGRKCCSVVTLSQGAPCSGLVHTICPSVHQRAQKRHEVSSCSRPMSVGEF